eukprot:5228331-Pyramimonas_sp.AAC.1
MGEYAFQAKVVGRMHRSWAQDGPGQNRCMCIVLVPPLLYRCRRQGDPVCSGPRGLSARVPAVGPPPPRGAATRTE